MASVTMPKSFAKVAATPVAISQKPSASALTHLSISHSTQSSGTSPEPVLQVVSNLTESVSRISLANAPNVTITGSNISAKAKSAGESDDSHPTDSDVGTKPPSLDGKSVTSGTTTTFAMDEKDSLRPDDSASVQAAADDDDASIRESLIAGSRVPACESRVPTGTRIGGIDGQIATMSNQPSPQVVPPNNPLENMYQQAPDDKLLEAIKSPKDRQFLLRLEVDVINFVQESKEPYMDLPPSNSFFRMLTHKLADYYHMTHSYEKDNGPGFVRIFRTPFCRVPPSLASIANSTRSPSPPPMPMKIMRRVEESEPALSSASQSKTTSEVGSDQKERAAIKERKTREEREEAYLEARKRIFGASDTTNPSVTNPGELASETADNGDGVSRASSVSAKDKSSVSGKRNKNAKQRRDSGSFESRNSYVPAWSHPQPWGQPQYVPANQAYQSMPQGQHGYPQPMPAGYNGMPVPGPQGSYGGPGYMPSGPMSGRYPPNGPPGPSMSPYNPNGVPHLQWQQPHQYPQNNRHQPPYGRPGPPNMGPNGIPYPYGQLPAHINPYDVKSQHPIPGSYNRNGSFNSKTQSFMPNTASLHSQQGPSTMYLPGPHGYNHYQQSPQMPPAQAYPSNYQMGSGGSMGIPINYVPPQGHYPSPQHMPVGPNNNTQGPSNVPVNTSGAAGHPPAIVHSQVGKQQKYAYPASRTSSASGPAPQKST